MRANAQTQTLHAILLGVFVSIILAMVKALAWIMTGSAALLASLADSLLDAIVSMINWVAVHRSRRPADDEHRFGHGKIEPLAAMAQAIALCVSAVFLAVQGVDRLLEPQPIRNGTVGIVVMLFSSILTIGLVVCQKAIVKRTGSMILFADHVHYVGDLLINVSVALSIVLSSQLGWTRADPTFALLISTFLIKSGLRIGKPALDSLMDRELPEEEQQRILSIASSEAQVLKVLNLQTRFSGVDHFIQIRVAMNGTLTLAAAHDAANAVESRLAEAFPGAKTHIRIEPSVPDNDDATAVAKTHFSTRARDIASSNGLRK